MGQNYRNVMENETNPVCCISLCSCTEIEREMAPPLCGAIYDEGSFKFWGETTTDLCAK